VVLMLTLYLLTFAGLAACLRDPRGRSLLDRGMAWLTTASTRDLLILTAAVALLGVFAVAAAYVGVGEVSLLLTLDAAAYMEAATALWLATSVVRVKLIGAKLRAMLRKKPLAPLKAARPRATNDNGPPSEVSAAKSNDDGEEEPARAA
jgi:hypothetical protein